MALRQRHYEALLELIGEVNATREVNEFREVLLAALLRAVPSDWVSYNEVWEDGATPVMLADPELPAWVPEVWGRHALENPMAARHRRTRDGRAYRFTDLVSTAELHALPLYRELYSRLGVEHQIAFMLPAPRSLTIGIALSRRRSDYTDAEREMLNLARPHLIQAYRNAQLSEASTELITSLRRGVDSSGAAIVVLDHAGTVSFVSEPARALAAEASLGPLAEGRPLPAGFDEALGAEAEAAVARGSGGDGVLVRRVPRSGPGSGVVVMLHRAGRVLSAEALRELGLTAREADVLAGVARGRRTIELAAELGISPRTVHKHLESIHRKLGVRTRAQAVITAWAAADLRMDA